MRVINTQEMNSGKPNLSTSEVLTAFREAVDGCDRMGGSAERKNQCVKEFFPAMVMVMHLEKEMGQDAPLTVASLQNEFKQAVKEVLEEDF